MNANVTQVLPGNEVGGEVAGVRPAGLCGKRAKRYHQDKPA